MMQVRTTSVCLFVCLYLISLINARQNFEQQLVRDVVASMCPYSTYCHTNATKRLPEKLTENNLCCLPCSCESDCWKMGRCCIDKDTTIDKPPIWNCKESLVKRSADGFIEDNEVEVRSFRIVDFCPSTEKSSFLITKCKAKYSMTLDELVWVSDKESGTIYQNRYCAECHGIEDIIHWQIRTQCYEFLEGNFSTLFNQVSSAKCYINNETPSKIRSVTEKYACVLPMYDKCNLTGGWRDFNESIFTACNRFNAPVFQMTIRNYESYKNVFCYICNGKNVEDISKFCPGRLEIGKSSLLQFSALINYKKYIDSQDDHNDFHSKQGCRVNEVFDKYTERCRLLICPYGKTPLYGRCEPLAKTTNGLAIDISYRLKILASSTRSVLYAHQNNSDVLGEKILTTFLKVSGLKKLKCQVCNWFIYANTTNTDKQNTTFTDFYCVGDIQTTPTCQMDDVAKLTSELLVKDWKVFVTDTDYLILQAVSEILIPMEMESKPIHEIALPVFCTMIRIRLPMERFCPAIDLNYSDISTLEDIKKSLLLKSLFEAKQHPNDSMRLCLDEYDSFMKLKASNAASAWTVMTSQLIVVATTITFTRRCKI